MKEQEKKTRTYTLTRKKRNCLLLFFYWMSSLLRRLFVDEPGREKREREREEKNASKERSSIHSYEKRNQPTK
jgi:hypothetical protein